MTISVGTAHVVIRQAWAAQGIEKVTGPVALMECTEAYARYAGRNVTVLEPGLVFAYNWHEVRVSQP